MKRSIRWFRGGERRRSTPISAMADDDRGWFPTLWQIHGSVVPAILPRVLFCAGFSAIVSLLNQIGLSLVPLPLAGLIPSIVLGLLLVFRTNTAYDRFWEGRKLWGTINNDSRNLARQIWHGIETTDAAAEAEKITAVRVVAAFAYALKDHLRQAPITSEALNLVPEAIVPEIQAGQHRPLILAFWLERYFQAQYKLGHLAINRLISLTQLLNVLVSSAGGCERILRTPMPFAYAIHLRQLLMIYCLLLPLEWVTKYGWWSVPLSSLIAFALFGIEEIGEEIENPFGHDPNDLPLDVICGNLARNLEEMIALRDKF